MLLQILLATRQQVPCHMKIDNNCFTIFTSTTNFYTTWCNNQNHTENGGQMVRRAASKGIIEQLSPRKGKWKGERGRGHEA